MNNTQVSSALLDGYSQPIFPSLVGELMSTQDEFEIHNNYSMVQVAMEIPGYQSAEVFQTSDDYYWHFGLIFVEGDSKMVILFPWHGEYNSVSNTIERQRSVAVYLVGEYNYEEILSLLIEGVKKRSSFLRDTQAKTRQAEDQILGPDNLNLLRQIEQKLNQLNN